MVSSSLIEIFVHIIQSILLRQLKLLDPVL